MASPILGKKDLDKAMALRERLSGDYLPFFGNMGKFYKNNLPGTEEAVLVGKTIAKIERSLTLIARVFLGRGVTASTQKELDLLNQNLIDIEEAKNFIVQKATEHSFVKAALESAIETSAITPQEMSLSEGLSKGFLGRVKERFAGKGRRGRGFFEGGLGSQILAPLLGPLFQLPFMAAAGIGAGVRGLGMLGGLKGIGLGKGRSGGRRSENIAPGSMPMMQPQVPMNTVVAQPSTSPTGPMSWLRDYQGRFIGGKGDVKAIQQGAMPIWFFFDKLAYRARWTKEVLATLKGRSDGREGGSFGLGSLGGLGVGAALAYTIPKLVELGDLISKYFEVTKETDKSKKKDDERILGHGNRELLASVKTIDALNVPEEEKHRRKLQFFKEFAARDEYEREKRRVEDLVQKGGMPKSRLEKGFSIFGGQGFFQEGPRLTTAPTVTPLGSPEIVLPSTTGVSEGNQYNQKVIDSLDAIKNEVRESGKKTVTGSPITGPYDSLVDPLLRGLNSSGADFLPNYLSR